MRFAFAKSTKDTEFSDCPKNSCHIIPTGHNLAIAEKYGNVIDLFWIIVIATSVWVLIDAKTIGVKKGQIQGMGNLGPWGWFFVCLLLWIIGFPFYLAKRSEFKRINSGLSQDSQSIAAVSPQAKKGLSIVHWVGIIVFGGIALLALFGQRDDGTTNIGHIASGGEASSSSTSQPEGSTTAAAIAKATSPQFQ